MDPAFAGLVSELETILEMKVWLLVQNGDEEWDEVGQRVYRGFRDGKDEMRKGERMGLLIHSPGGQASYAYKTIRLFQRRTDDFTTIVPAYAKSAATLMAIGGKQILMGSDAELGPLDVQMYDGDKDRWESALNASQSMERSYPMRHAIFLSDTTRLSSQWSFRARVSREFPNSSGFIRTKMT